MRPGSAPLRQRGFALVAVLAAVLLLGLGCERVMTVVSLEARRMREAELLRVGDAYAEAIRSYHRQGPGATRRWPPTVAELLDDRRFVQVKRHLREPYADPLTGGEWGIVPAPDGGIAGVYSRSTERPVRAAAQQLVATQLPVARRYADWLFVPQLDPEPKP